MRLSDLFKLAFAGLTVLASVQAHQAQGSVDTFPQAQYRWASLPSKEAVRASLYLIATGHYNGMFERALSRRVFRAIQDFQREHGLAVTGVLDDRTFEALRRAAQGFFMRVGMIERVHPFRPSRLFVPLGLGFREVQTPHGLAFEREDKAAAIDFSWRAEADVSFEGLWRNFTRESRSGHIEYKVMRDGFFVVHGRVPGGTFYTRWERVDGGSIGFTLRFNESMIPDGLRIGILMSNAFVPQITGHERQQAEAQPRLNPQRPEDVPPGPQRRIITTGSGFFVNTDGALVTNAHVVEGCSEVQVPGYGRGDVIARDNTNDIALVKIFGRTTPVRFKSGSVALGETVYVLGFPLAGVLDNGLNFTNGLVSSLAGIKGDSRLIQVTAPVQPGNSGGPLVDRNGRLLGVMVARLKESHLPQNVNFAIRGELVRSFLQSHSADVTEAAVDAPHADSGALDPTAIAAMGRAYTVQVMCRP